ncbi:MAG: glycogen synthase GlgA [Rhizobiaceae bacterium]
MRVLAVASEIFPLVKTGGLADVTGALPGALAGEGVAALTLIPGYPPVRARLPKKTKPVHAWASLQGGAATLLRAKVDGLDLLVLDAPHLFDRPGGPYADPTGADYTDNWRRYAALGKAASEVAGGALMTWRPDVVHAHDWQAAMTPAYMRYGGAPDVPSVITVHNLAFQGQFGASIFPGLGLPSEAMGLDGVEYYGGVGYLKAGLQSAWAITTVSPTYAEEIRTPEFGMGLDGLINTRGADLHGIVNGIDTDVWNPATDDLLAARYSARALAPRLVNRRAVEAAFHLDPDSSGPVLAIISRLTWQKGIDMVASAVDAIVAAGARLAVLGSGDRALEGALLSAAARHRGKVGVKIGYDEALSHLMQGGCDGIIVPSRFEPCGLTQLCGLRYGCVPLVARTGGLADTVVDANDAALTAGAATGFVFQPGSGDAMLRGVKRAVDAFNVNGLWRTVQKQGMKAEVSWTRGAARYASLYRSLIDRSRKVA